MLTGWKAIYNDGKELPQYNEDGSANQYPSINREKLVQFVFIIDGKPKVIIHLDKNKRLIYRRRVAQALFDKKLKVVYLLGWQETKNGVNQQMICALFQDGHVEVVDGFREDHPWFYSVNFIKEEKL